MSNFTVFEIEPVVDFADYDFADLTDNGNKLLVPLHAGAKVAMELGHSTRSNLQFLDSFGGLNAESGVEYTQFERVFLGLVVSFNLVLPMEQTIVNLTIENPSDSLDLEKLVSSEITRKKEAELKLTKDIDLPEWAEAFMHAPKFNTWFAAHSLRQITNINGSENLILDFDSSAYLAVGDTPLTKDEDIKVPNMFNGLEDLLKNDRLDKRHKYRIAFEIIKSALRL